MGGCASQKLPQNWEPLKRIVERNHIEGFEHVLTAVSPYLYTADLDWFNETYPEGSIEHEALRKHEVQHALEQEVYVDGATGAKRLARLAKWIHLYLTDKNFRWEAEKKGYKEEILYLKSQGHYIYPDAYARILSGKTYNNMVSYEVALEWIKAVLNGDI